MDTSKAIWLPQMEIEKHQSWHPLNFISFENPNSMKFEAGNSEYPYEIGFDRDELRASSTSTRNSVQAKDHVLAERKRREKINQQFLALSALLPDLKKLDKASVLENAIENIKQLQEKERILDQEMKKNHTESVVCVKRFRSSQDGVHAFLHQNYDISSNELPDITITVSENIALLRLHFRKQKGLLAKIFGEVHKHDLTIINSNVMKFGSSALVVSIVAQMDVNFSGRMKDLVRSLEIVIS